MSALPVTDLFEIETPKPQASVLLVTPEMAKRWLARNTRNRSPKPINIAKYARDMAAGEWRLTGEGIKFSSDGTLLDGQNRLMACIKCGEPFLTYVFRGIDDTAQAVMDTGGARTASDALAINGEKNTSVLAAAARLALAIDADVSDPERFQPTHSQIQTYIDENPGLRHAAQFASKVSRKTDCPPAMVAYTAWVLGQIDLDAAKDFWTTAADKVGLSAGDPVIALTNRFAEARRNRERLHKRAMLSAIYRAWNYRRAGKPLRIVKFNSPNGGPIPIPEPK